MGKQVALLQILHLRAALKQEEQLGGERVALGVLIKAWQKRVFSGIFDQQFRLQVRGNALGQAGFADADGAFNGDVTVFFQHYVCAPWADQVSLTGCRPCGAPVR